jgi:O-antigen ligase
LRQAARDKILLQDFSGQIRRTIWSETWIMLKDRPILGAGLAGYQKTIVPYHHYNIWIGKTMQPVEIYLYPHNILFNFWSELGLFGLAVFVLILIKYFYLAIKNIRSKDQEIKRSVISNNRLLITDYRLLSLSLLCIMVVILIHGLVDVPYFKNDLSVMFWLFIGILTIITLNKNLFIKKES